MCANELSPRCRTLPFRRGWNILAQKNVIHRLLGYRVAELRQGTHDAILTPIQIIFGHSHHELLDFGIYATRVFTATQ